MPAVHSTLTLKFKDMNFVPKRNSKNIGEVKVIIPTRQPVTIEFKCKFNFMKNTIDVKSKNFTMLSPKQQKIVVNKVIDYVSDLWDKDLPDSFYDASYSEIATKIDCPKVSYKPTQAPKKAVAKKAPVKKVVEKAKTKKAVVKKAPAKKAVVKKTVAKKKVVKKEAVKKVALKKSLKKLLRKKSPANKK